MTSSACPHCGLTFKDGQREFETFGKPAITLAQHVRNHGDVSPAAMTIIPSPDGLAEARALRAEFEEFSPRTMYDDSGGYNFGAELESARRRQAIRAKALALIGERTESGFLELAAAGAFHRDTAYGYGYSRAVTPEGEVVARPNATKAQLARHAERFAKGPARIAKLTRDAVDEVAGRTASSESQIARLYRDGHTVPEIVKLTGKTERSVRAEVAKCGPSRKPASVKG